MGIRNLFLFTTIFILVSSSGLFALGQAASMGNLQTVVPSGPFDVARNPALLTAQTASNSTGLFYSYIMHFPGDESAKANSYYYDGISTTTYFRTDMKLEEPEIKGMNANIANSTKLSRSTIGFAFTNDGDDQYSVEEREISREEYNVTAVPTLMKTANEKTEKTSVNPAFITSIGFNISNTSSIGFQLLAKYTGIIEKIEYYGDQILPAVFVKSEKIKNKTEKFSGELGFGYFHKDNNSEIGLQIKTGNFSWIKKSISVDSTRIIPAPVLNSKADDSITLNGKHTSGPSITCGGYKRIASFFAVGIESKFTFQNSFTNEELKVQDTVPISVKSSKNTVGSNNAYLLNGGLEFDLSTNLSFSTGLGYSSVTYNGSNGGGDSKNKNENNIQFTYATAGIDYLIAQNFRVSLIGLLVSYKMNGQEYGRFENNITNERSEIHSEIKSEGYYLHTGLGVIMSF